MSGHPSRPAPDHVARASSPRGELVLRRRAADPGPDSGPEHPVEPVLELRANGIFVMDTAETTSERALATASLELVERPAEVLVGGLGLGFTLHEVLADSRVQRCTVVEIEPALVDWMRDGTVPHGPALLADERVRVALGDVAAVLAEADESAYDLVLLDVDNGPGHLVHDANAAIYRVPLLAAARRALRPGGALVIWSAATSEELEAALREVFGDAEALEQDVRLQGRPEKYWLYAART